MARIRYLKPEFFTDEDLADLSFEARIFFAGLWCHADKAGRLEDRPKFLKAMIFPYDKVDAEKILQILERPKKSGRPYIQRYTNGTTRRFIQILRWDCHQRPHHTEKDSEIPEPPKIPPAPPLNTKEKGMEMENQLEASLELNNAQLTVKNTLKMKDSNKKELFEKFWQMFPKKRSKGQAERAWDKIHPDEQLLEKMLSTIERAKTSDDWLKNGGEYIPYPATWLNAKGWEDEIKSENENWIEKVKAAK